MSSLSIQDILAQTDTAKDFLDEKSKQITDVLTQASTLAGKSAEIATQAAADAALVSTTKSAADLSVQTAKQKVGITFGTDISAQNEVYTMLSGIEQDAWNRKRAAKAEIDRKESVSLLDNPIEHILNQFTINKDIRAYNGASRDQEDALKRIGDLNQATSATAALQANFGNFVTTASAEAAARLASADAKIKANQFTLESYKFNIEGLKEVISANAQKLSFTFQAKTAQNADAQLALAAHNSARADEEWKFRKEQKLKDDKYDSSIIDEINYGRAIRGASPLVGVKADAALAALKGKGPGAELFLSDWKAGSQLDVNGRPQLAQTPAEMAARFSSGQPIGLAPMQEIIRDRFNDITTKITSVAGFDPKDVIKNNKTLNKDLVDSLVQDSAEVKPGDITNPFSVAPINQVVKTIPAAADTLAYQTVLKPLMEKGVDMNDPNRVFEAIKAGMKAGDITFNEAVDGITTIYTAASAANLAGRDLKKFGIPEMPQFYRYNVRVGREVIDVTKPDLVSRKLNMMLVQDSVFGGNSQSNPFPVP